jgi:hypothetical protein
MAKSISATTKRKPGPGRPKTTGKGVPSMVRLHPPLLTWLDQWIDRQEEPKPSRPEAIRTLLTERLFESRSQRRIAARVDRDEEEPD